MFIPDHFAANAYRVLRLAADASLTEAHRAAAALTRKAALGPVPLAAADVAELGVLQRTEAEIRMALGRLQSPTQRVRDRLFWFFARPEQNPIHADHVDIVREHDLALRSLISASCSNVDQGVEVWSEALSAWQRVVASDEYWLLAARIEETGEYEPAALPSEIGAIRDDAVALAAQGLLMAARDALAREELATLHRIVTALTALQATVPWSERAVSELLSPPETDFHELCRQARTDLRGKLDRSEEGVEANTLACTVALEHFRARVEPALSRLLHFVPLAHPAAHSCREQAALCLASVAVGLTWAEDFEGAVKLQTEAVALAHETVSLIGLERDLVEIKGVAQRQAAHAADESAAPSVRQLHAACRSLQETVDNELVRKPEMVALNKSVCFAGLRRFRSEIQPLLKSIELDLPGAHPTAQRCREHMAVCLAELAGAFTWAEDFVESESLSIEALALAGRSASAERIERALRQVQPNARRQRVFGQLLPMSSAPSLSTLNGVGFMLYGAAHQDAESDSYVTTRYFVFLFLPLLPVCRYRVVSEGNAYRFLGRLPLTDGQRWHRRIAIGACVAWVLMMILNPTSSQVNSRTERDYSRSSQASSNSNASSALQKQIEENRVQLKWVELELKPVLDELESLKPKIEALDAQLREWQAKNARAEAVDTKQFNAKAREHSALVERHQKLLNENKAEIANYKQLFQKDQELVIRYNLFAR